MQIGFLKYIPRNSYSKLIFTTEQNHNSSVLKRFMSSQQRKRQKTDNNLISESIPDNTVPIVSKITNLTNNSWLSSSRPVTEVRRSSLVQPDVVPNAPASSSSAVSVKYECVADIEDLCTVKSESVLVKNEPLLPSPSPLAPSPPQNTTHTQPMLVSLKSPSQPVWIQGQRLHPGAPEDEFSRLLAAGSLSLSQTNLAKPHTAPSRFVDTWEGLEEMRKEGGVAGVAAVDTMGCAVLADRSAPAPVFRFQTLVALMLSSQTKDEVTAAAIHNLKTHIPGGLTASSLLLADPSVVHSCIKSVGFHNNKLRYLYQAARAVQDQFGGDIPRTVKELCGLAGVGPKMANLCVQVAWDQCEGIGVDIHVHRISNRLGWHSTKTPEHTRVALESWLPKSYWERINVLLVGFGQNMCSAINPKCGQCVLAEKMICPSSTVKSLMRKNLKEQSDNECLVKKE